MNQRILLAGATGMVGAATLRSVLEDPNFKGTVFAPIRAGRTLAQQSENFFPLPSDFTASGADALITDAIQRQGGKPLQVFISCLGTTIRAAGSREAFIAVDRELVQRMAQLAFNLGARHAILVSSAGASRQSGNFYLRVKGEVEDALEKIGFDRLDIMQPGLLIGERGERRPVEAIAQRLAPLANLGLQGKFRRYRSIQARQLADAIARLACEGGSGQFVHTFDSIMALSRTD